MYAVYNDAIFGHMYCTEPDNLLHIWTIMLKI